MSKDSARLRSEVLDRVADEAERNLNDERYDWIRPVERRRGLVLLAVATGLIYAVSSLADWSIVTLLALVGYVALLWLLRIAVRAITDLPDEFVDERHRKQRDATYRLAYLGTMGFISVAILAYIVDRLLWKAGVSPGMSADQLHELILATFFLSMGLPSAIYAWREPEI